MWMLPLVVSCPHGVGWSLDLEGPCLGRLRLSESGKKGSGGPACDQGQVGAVAGPVVQPASSISFLEHRRTLSCAIPKQQRTECSRHWFPRFLEIIANLMLLAFI